MNIKKKKAIQKVIILNRFSSFQTTFVPRSTEVAACVFVEAKRKEGLKWMVLLISLRIEVLVLGVCLFY